MVVLVRYIKVKLMEKKEDKKVQKRYYESKMGGWDANIRPMHGKVMLVSLKE